MVNKFNSNPKWYIFTDKYFSIQFRILIFAGDKTPESGGGGHQFMHVNGVLTLNKHCVNIVLC